MTRRGATQALAAIAVCAVAGLAATPAALAHAILERSEPSDGTVLAQSPRTIRLWFSQDVVAKLSAAELLDGDGRPLTTSKLEPDPSKPGLLTVALPELRRGVYDFRWAVLSEEDSHLRRGGLVFRVGTGVTPAPSSVETKNSLTELDAGLRWLNLALLVALIGAIGAAVLVLAEVERRAPGEALIHAAGRARRRVEGWSIWCAGLSLAVGLGLLAVQSATLARDVPGDAGFADFGRQLLTDSRWGGLWLARELILIALLVALLVVRRAAVAGRRRFMLPAIALAVALATVQALGGHAAAAPAPAFTVPVATLHLLAAAMWVGGLLALLIGLSQHLRPGASRSVGVTRACLRHFSRPAALSVGLLLATGLFYAGQQVASLDALVTTLYGQVLTAKAALILGMATVGLVNALLLDPRLVSPLAWVLGRSQGWSPIAPSRLGTLLVAEAGLGLAVVAAAGVLTATAPAGGPEFAPTPKRIPVLSQTVGDLLVTVSVKPSLPGPNLFRVLAVSTRRPPPAEVERVSLRYTGPNGEGKRVSVPLREAEQRRYRLGGGFIRAAGTWPLEVVIERVGLEPTVARFDWPVAPAGSRRPVLISDRPLEPILTKASVLALLVLAVAFGWLALARRVVLVRQPGRRSQSLERTDAASPS